MSEVVDHEVKAKKSDLTRQKIIDAALELFREHGYDETTMRMIAERAGVAVGNSYYYFRSKDQLIQGYYESLHVQWREKATEIFANTTDFSERLRQLLLVHIEMLEPYHQFSATFIRNAANPNDSVSPFSVESAPTRNAAIDVFREAMASSKLRISPEIKQELPELLWLFHMGVTLFWVYDRTPNSKRTKELIKRTVPLVVRLIQLTRLPVLKSIALELLKAKSEITAIT